MESSIDQVGPEGSQPIKEPSWNPLKCTGTDLPRNLTILAKALAFVLITQNEVMRLPYPWLPFIPGLDAIPAVLFQSTLRVIFVIGLFLVVFNRRVRLGALILGSVILFSCLASKLYQGHNKLACAVVLILTGLYQPGAPNYLRWQLMLIYFGAGLNKVLTKDWRNGIFFEHFGMVAHHQPLYALVDSWLPPMWLGRFMGWATIVTEFGVVPLLFSSQLFFWANLANIFFQLNLMWFVGGTFGLFTYSMCAFTFALVKWPSAPIPVVYDLHVGFAQWTSRFFKSWDVDHSFIWLPYRSDVGEKYGISSIVGGKGLRILVGNKIYSGFRAFRMILLLNPITYFVMGAVLSFSEYIPASPGIRYPGTTYLQVVGGTFFVLLFPPLAWMADMIFGGKDVQPPRGNSVSISELSQS